MRYNGWANFATWKVNLEVFSDLEIQEVVWGWQELDSHDKANELYEYARCLVYKNSDGLTKELALAYLEEVDWNEIANSLS